MAAVCVVMLIMLNMYQKLAAATLEPMLGAMVDALRMMGPGAEPHLPAVQVWGGRGRAGAVLVMAGRTGMRVTEFFFSFLEPLNTVCVPFFSPVIATNLSPHAYISHSKHLVARWRSPSSRYCAVRDPPHPAVRLCVDPPTHCYFAPQPLVNELRLGQVKTLQFILQTLRTLSQSKPNLLKQQLPSLVDRCG